MRRGIIGKYTLIDKENEGSSHLTTVLPERSIHRDENEATGTIYV